MKKNEVLDLRSVAPADREARVAERLTNLGSHRRLSVVQDQHPRGLCEALEQKFGSQIECRLQDECPGEWTLEIWRSDSCCGIC